MFPTVWQYWASLPAGEPLSDLWHGLACCLTGLRRWMGLMSVGKHPENTERMRGSQCLGDRRSAKSNMGRDLLD